jgi:hypothetical protein
MLRRLQVSHFLPRLSPAPIREAYLIVSYRVSAAVRSKMSHKFTYEMAPLRCVLFARLKCLAESVIREETELDDSKLLVLLLLWIGHTNEYRTSNSYSFSQLYSQLFSCVMSSKEFLFSFACISSVIPRRHSSHVAFDRLRQSSTDRLIILIFENNAD